MRATSRYSFDSCLRTFYEGHRLFFHVRHSAGAEQP